VKRRRIRRLGIEGDVGDGPGPIKVHALHTGRIRQKALDPGQVASDVTVPEADLEHRAAHAPGRPRASAERIVRHAEHS
jgi:hypothetical protein